MSQDANNVEMIDFNLKIKIIITFFLIFFFLFFFQFVRLLAPPRLEIRIAISISTLFFHVCRHYRRGFLRHCKHNYSSIVHRLQNSNAIEILKIPNF